MEILSHRGFWLDESERNTPIAFERSFNLGMGTETDLRDHHGEIVISHDMPTGAPQSFADVLRIMNGRNLTLALNIKADGLSRRIKDILRAHGHTNYFTFDMSAPDLVRQLQDDMVVYTGLSDIQPHPVLEDQCSGIWLDCFSSDWYGADLIDGLIDRGKRVCVVSADLHKRSTDAQWNMIRTCKTLSSPYLSLCTDKPLEAQSFFGVN